MKGLTSEAIMISVVWMEDGKPTAFDVSENLRQAEMCVE